VKTNIRMPLSISATPVKNRYVFFLALFIFFSTGCTYDKEELLNPPPKQNACDTLNATFANVHSIISTKCSTSRCHGAAAAKGGAILETYDQIKAKADRIKQRALTEKTMPPSAPLTTNDIAVLQCWFDSGMPNN
jgi:uncharacterized membrane protein